MTDMSIMNHDHDGQFGGYSALSKPRVMNLVVFTALVGLLVAPADLAYTFVLAVCAIWLGFAASGRSIYRAAALGLNGWFLKGAWSIARRDVAAIEADKYAVEKGFFRFSILYLFLYFGALLADAALRTAGVF